MQRKFSLLSLVTMSLLCALSVVLGTVLSFKAIPLGGTYTVNVALNLLPVQLAGLLFGPLAGFLVGIASDFVKWIVIPIGPYHPGLSFSLGMMGFLPALLLQYMGRQPIALIHGAVPETLHAIKLSHLFIAIGVTQLLFSVCLNSYWIAMMQGRAIWALLPVRLINQAVMIPLYSVLLREITRLCVRLKLA